MSRPQLLPIFRTPSQGLILSHLLALDAGPSSLTQLSERTGIPLSTVQREITALERAGLVRTSRVGNVRLATADTDSPYYEDLRSLLLKAYGPATVLADALENVTGVDAAYIFGSWARRYGGEAGPAPNDVDLVVVGEVDPTEVYAAVRDAEQTLSLDVNPVVVSAGEWSQPKGFLARVKDGPLVELAGDAPATDRAGARPTAVADAEEALATEADAAALASLDRMRRTRNRAEHSGLASGTAQIVADLAVAEEIIRAVRRRHTHLGSGT